mmetsp:Transcript_25437/g.65750  ORF Transcript_25437/g.65750 Transcript_25437/m.65750 type:complete len:137 (-) Transcript_25437:35-445(-)
MGDDGVASAPMTLDARAHLFDANLRPVVQLTSLGAVAVVCGGSTPPDGHDDVIVAIPGAAAAPKQDAVSTGSDGATSTGGRRDELAHALPQNVGFVRAPAQSHAGAAVAAPMLVTRWSSGHISLKRVLGAQRTWLN